MWNRNWKPEQSVSDGVDMKLIKIDQNSVAQFDAALNDLLDETKIELASRSDKPVEPIRPPTAEMRPSTSRSAREKPINTPTATPRSAREKPSNMSTTTPSLAREYSINTPITTPRSAREKPVNTPPATSRSAREKPADTSTATPRSAREKPVDASTATPRSTREKPISTATTTLSLARENPINTPITTPRSAREKPVNTPPATPRSAREKPVNTPPATPRSAREKPVDTPPATPRPTREKSVNTPPATPRSAREKPVDTPPATPRPTREKSVDTPPATPRSARETPINTPSTTPRRNSPFNFVDSPRKMDSSSSMDTGDGGFFTDVIPRKVVISQAPPVTERSASKERKHSATNRSIEQRSASKERKHSATNRSTEQRTVIPNLLSLRKTSIESLTRAPPKRSITLEETRQQMDDHSRPGSSLSSASLPVSITSSKPDLITRPSIERHPKLVPQPPPQPPPQTTKKFRVEFPKKSSPPTIAPMVIEGKKVTSAKNSARESDEHLQQSTNSTKSKISSSVQKSQNLLKTSSTSSMTSITRDDNILRDESMTITDLPINKSINRRSTNVDREPTKSRKIEFSVRDGTKWQQASSE